MACSFPFGAGGIFTGLANATLLAQQTACSAALDREAFPPGDSNCYISNTTNYATVVYRDQCDGCIPSDDSWLVLAFGFFIPVVHPTFVLSCNVSTTQIGDIQYSTATTDTATYALAVQDYSSEVFCRAECTRRKVCVGYVYTPTCLLLGAPGVDQVFVAAQSQYSKRNEIENQGSRAAPKLEFATVLANAWKDLQVLLPAPTTVRACGEACASDPQCTTAVYRDPWDACRIGDVESSYGQDCQSIDANGGCINGTLVEVAVVKLTPGLDVWIDDYVDIVSNTEPCQPDLPYIRMLNANVAKIQGCSHVVGIEYTPRVEIAPTAFRGCTQLKSVEFLGGHGGRTSFTSCMQPQVLDPHCIEVVDSKSDREFSCSKLQTFPRNWGTFTNISRIDFSGQALVVVPDFAFAGCPYTDTTFVNLNLNLITLVGTQAFAPLLKINSISLSETPLTLISYGAFAGLTQLQNLNLEFTPLRAFDLTVPAKLPQNVSCSKSCTCPNLAEGCLAETECPQAATPVPVVETELWGIDGGAQPTNKLSCIPCSERGVLDEAITRVHTLFYSECPTITAVVAPGLVPGPGYDWQPRSPYLEKLDIASTVNLIGAVTAKTSTEALVQPCSEADLVVKGLASLEYAYRGCLEKKLEVAAPAAVIAQFVFADNANLEQVTMPPTLIQIDPAAFANTAGIRSLLIPETTAKSINANVDFVCCGALPPRKGTEIYGTCGCGARSGCFGDPVLKADYRYAVGATVEECGPGTHNVGPLLEVNAAPLLDPGGTRRITVDNTEYLTPLGKIDTFCDASIDSKQLVAVPPTPPPPPPPVKSQTVLVLPDNPGDAETSYAAVVAAGCIGLVAFVLAWFGLGGR